MSDRDIESLVANLDWHKPVGSGNYGVLFPDILAAFFLVSNALSSSK